MHTPDWIYKQLPVIYFTAGFLTGAMINLAGVLVIPTICFYLAGMMAYEMRVR